MVQNRVAFDSAQLLNRLGLIVHVALIGTLQISELCGHRLDLLIIRGRNSVHE